MKTMLFINETNGEIMHFFRAKEWLAEKLEAELPITDDEAERMLLDDNNISVISDEPYRWCVRYAQYMEADRYLTAEEKAMSIYNIYIAIVSKDEMSLRSVFDALKENENAAGIRLLISLNNLLEEREVER